MFLKNLIKSIFVSAIVCYPVFLWATRGSDDYGIIMTVMFILVTFPAGLTLLGFIIYSIAILKRNKKSTKKQGKIVFIISLIIIPLTIIIPLGWMYSAKWHHLMIELMLVDFIPILLLSSISAVLAKFVKKRSLDSYNDKHEMNARESEPSGNNEKKISKIFIILLLLLLLILMAFIFKYCFM